MESVDLAINGSYLAYVYVVLLQISVVYLQRPDLDRRLRDQKPSATPAFYSAVPVSSVLRLTGSAGCFRPMWRKNSA